MKYVGLQSQISSNNTKSILLLIAFPLLVIGLTWVFFLGLHLFQTQQVNTNIDSVQTHLETNTPEEIENYLDKGQPLFSLTTVNTNFIHTVPFVSIGVIIWFFIAWSSHSSIIHKATGARPLARTENKRVYNLVENLCISRGMTPPKVYIIEDNSLNAYASGLSQKSFAVTLSRGIINKLDDDELEGVIAHELTHIINRDVRLLIISIIFVGIFSLVTEIAFRSMLYGSRGSDKKGNNMMYIVLLAVGIIGMIFSTVFRFALSQKREYLADAGAAEMTKKPWALASALRKISQNPWIASVKQDSIAQMFIEHPQKKRQRNPLTSLFNSMFATHPPIEKRIEVLEQL